MKSTKTILAVAIVIAGATSCGCGGSDVAGQVDLAGARATCDSAQRVFEGRPFTDDEFNTLVITAEVARDEGTSQFTFLRATNIVCVDANETDEETALCIQCWTAVSAAVWP